MVHGCIQVEILLYCIYNNIKHMTLFGKALVSIVLLGVVGGGYITYSFMNTKTTADATNQPQGIAWHQDGQGEPNPSAPATSTQAGKKIAFSQLLEQKGTYKCTVTQHVANMDTQGTVYMNEGMVRAEFSTIIQGQKMDTTMISREGYTYSWSSMMPNMGYKVKIDTTAKPSAATDTKAQTSGSYSWNAEQIGDYNCEAWTADASKFAIPKGITFTQVN